MNTDKEWFLFIGEGISKRHVTASWSGQCSRKTLPALDSHIDEVWIQRRKENPLLYDGSKFRLNAIKVECSGSEKPPHVHFDLGNTSYKKFIGTNCSPQAVEIIQNCVSAAGSVNIQEYMADPLAVGSLLETLDHKFVFMRRSDVCGEAQGMIDRPGGHPEPENIKLNAQNGELDDDVRSSVIVEELFSSIHNEIRDELNIPVEKLGESALFGIVYNKETNDRPSLEFYTRCFMTSEEVHTEYLKQTQLEKEESVELIFISSSELLSLIHKQSGPLWLQLTPAAQGAIVMFSICHSYHHL